MVPDSCNQLAKVSNFSNQALTLATSQQSQRNYIFPPPNLSKKRKNKTHIHIMKTVKLVSLCLGQRQKFSRQVCSDTWFFLLQQHKCNGRLSSETRFILIQLHKFIGHVTSETCFLKLNYTSLMDSRIRKHVSFWFKHISVIDSGVRGLVLNMCYNTCTIVCWLYVSSVMS